MSEQTIALVTGANKGTGYEIAAGLGTLGWRVGAGARDRERRESAVAKLRAGGVDAFGVPLDVTDDASVAEAAALIEESAGRLDVMVNNAGITGSAPQAPTTVDPATVRTVVETNVIGVIRVTNAMLPLLRRSSSPRIVNMSSGVGSLTRQTTPGAGARAGPVPASPARHPGALARRAGALADARGRGAGRGGRVAGRGGGRRTPRGAGVRGLVRVLARGHQQAPLTRATETRKALRRLPDMTSPCSSAGRGRGRFGLRCFSMSMRTPMADGIPPSSFPHDAVTDR